MNHNFIFVGYQGSQHPYINSFGFINKNFLGNFTNLSSLTWLLVNSNFQLPYLSDEMLIFSFFIDIISVQFFILLQHPLISLIQPFLFLLSLNFNSLGFRCHNRNLVVNVMRDESSSYAVGHWLLLVDLNSLAVGWVAVDWQLAGLTYSVAAVYQELLGWGRNKVALDTLGIGEVGLRLFCNAVTQRIAVFSVIEFLNGHIGMCGSCNNNRLRLGVMTNNHLFLSADLFPRRRFRWRTSFDFPFPQSQTGEDTSLLRNVHKFKLIITYCRDQLGQHNNQIWVLLTLSRIFSLRILISEFSQLQESVCV